MYYICDTRTFFSSTTQYWKLSQHPPHNIHVPFLRNYIIQPWSSDISHIKLSVILASSWCNSWCIYYSSKALYPKIKEDRNLLLRYLSQKNWSSSYPVGLKGWTAAGRRVSACATMQRAQPTGGSGCTDLRQAEVVCICLLYVHVCVVSVPSTAEFTPAVKLKPLKPQGDL